MRELLDKLHYVPIPLAIKEQQGDQNGTIHELEVRSQSCHARVAWETGLPEEWRQLATIVEEMVVLFKSSIKRAGRPGKTFVPRSGYSA
jgi:hypothetical protein